MKFFLILGFFVALGLSLDLYSTFLLFGNGADNVVELHFMVQVFDMGFKGLSIFFLLEFIFLIILLYIFFFNNYKRKKQRDYKILKLTKKQNIYTKEKIIKSIPFFIGVFFVFHFIASINNFFIYFYNSGRLSNAFLNSTVDSYINFIYINSNLYLVYVFMMVTYIFLAIFFISPKESFAYKLF